MTKKRYASVIGPKVLNYFSKTYFGIDFPLVKLPKFVYCHLL